MRERSFERGIDDGAHDQTPSLATSDPDSVPDRGELAEERRAGLARRLAGELAGLVEAGDLDGARLIHDTMGRLLETPVSPASSAGQGAQVLPFRSRGRG